MGQKTDFRDGAARREIDFVKKRASLPSFRASLSGTRVTMLSELKITKKVGFVNGFIRPDTSPI